MYLKPTLGPNLVRMPPPFPGIDKRQANEAQTNPPKEVRHLSMAKWPARCRTQKILKKEGTAYGNAHKANDEGRTTGKSRHHGKESFELLTTCPFWNQRDELKTGEEAGRSARNFVSTTSGALTPRNRRVGFES